MLPYTHFEVAMGSWRENHLELLYLCQSFNSSSDVGKAAHALNLSLNASSRSRISQLIRERHSLNPPAFSCLSCDM